MRAGVPLAALSLAACSGVSEGITTQSVSAEPPKVAAAPVEPNCATIKAEIDRLTAAKLPEKLQQAAAKKYNPTPDEWSAFPRYNSLVDTYTVKKCEPALQQAAKPAATKPKAATPAPGKVAAAAGAPAAPAVAKPKVAPAQAGAPVAATPTTPAAGPAEGQPGYQGVTIQLPQQPKQQ
jgi:hypothetical protein